MSEYKYKAFISYSHADEKWARWLAETGADEEAGEALRAALAQQLKLNDPDHEGTAITRTGLAELLTRSGEYELALAQADMAVASMTKTLSAERQSTGR
jgi:hypothetical protein